MDVASEEFEGRREGWSPQTNEKTVMLLVGICDLGLDYFALAQVS